MITDNGKAYIARNFGVNNCYAMDEIVPCTVYTDGTPNVRTLDTSTILFVLVTEVADKVKTAAGTFTLANLLDANDGSYISMMDALEIAPYCITGAPPTPPVTPPVTPPYTPPVTPPPTGAKDYEIINPTVNCDSNKCYARFNLRNNSSSASVYIRVEIDGAPCYKRYVYILRGATKPQVVSTSVTGLSSGYHNLTIVVGKITDTDTYTHKFLVGGPGIEPPVTPAAKMTAAEIVAELGKRGPIDTTAVSTTTGKDKWYLVRGEWGGTWLSYVATNFIKSISLDIDVRNPPTQAADITLKANHNVVSELDRDWILARIAELPFKAPPVTPPSGVPGVTIAVDKTTCGMNEQIRLTGTYTGEDGRILVGHDLGFHGYLKGTKKYLGKTKTTSGGQYSFTYAPTDEGTWQFTAYNDYTSPKVTVTVTPPVTPPSEPPEAIKAWIVRNYGDGTRVTSDGWRKLSDAEMAGALAPMPSGYTKADITGSVISWAMDNPNWETQTICGWIIAIGVTNLTEDHGRYVYQLAKGRTSVSDRIYNLLSPKPTKPSAGFVTEDNGRGVFQYAKGRKATGNKITGCNF